MSSAAQRLPKDPIDRAAALLARSLPATRETLPASLPPEAAQIIMQARNERAVMYSSMEDLSDRCRILGEEMVESGVVMHLVDDEDADSMVNHIEEAHRSLVVAAVELAEGSGRAEEVVAEVRKIPLAAGSRSR